MAVADALQKFSLPFAEEDEQRLLALAGDSRLLLGAIKSLLLTNALSYDDIVREFQAQQDGTDQTTLMLQQALYALSAGECAPLYALCVVLSQASEPLSEKDLSAVWQYLPFPEAGPDAEDLLLILLRLNFVEMTTKSGAPKFQLNQEVKAEVLRRLSPEDSVSANIAFVHFYSNQTGNDDERTQKWQRHLIAAGLHREAVQLAAAYAPALMKAEKTEAALALLRAAIPLANALNEEVELFLRHQLATGAAKLMRFDDAIAELSIIAEKLRQAGNTAAEFAVRHQLSSALAAKGDYANALTGFQDLMQKQYDHHNPSGVATAAAQVGLVALAMQNTKLAVEHFYIAKRLSEQLSEFEQKVNTQNWEFLREQLGEEEFLRHFSDIRLSAESYCETLLSQSKSG
ncbi:MAG: hypothetical protein ACK41G_10905 [Candidatus Thermochlorobacter sp.]